MSRVFSLAPGDWHELRIALFEFAEVIIKIFKMTEQIKDGNTYTIVCLLQCAHTAAAAVLRLRYTFRSVPRPSDVPRLL